MDELIDRIAAEANIDREVARRGLVIMVGFISKEVPPDQAKELIDGVPGVRPLAEEAGGSGGGGLMGVYGELTAAGLGMGAIQTVARQFVAYARSKAGNSTVDAVVSAIPGLSTFV